MQVFPLKLFDYDDEFDHYCTQRHGDTEVFFDDNNDDNDDFWRCFFAVEAL